MDLHTAIKRRRGRPPKSATDLQPTREALLRCGMALLTETGYSASSLDRILRAAGVPKGSFYHYFASKDAFVEALLAYYADFFRHLLDSHLQNFDLAPLERLEAFMQAAARGMAKYQFRRGCLIGNLGQEANALPEAFRSQIQAILGDWQQRVACCLKDAQRSGAIAPALDIDEQAYLFWTGWEGAVLRAKLEQQDRPLRLFARHFLAGLKHS